MSNGKRRFKGDDGVLSLRQYAIIVALIDHVAWPICIELAGQLG